MNITETSIPDVTKHNISENKEYIANNIINNIYPLFDEIYQAKLSQATQLKNEIKDVTGQLFKEKQTMEQLVNAYKKEKKISKVLERIEKLVQAGLAYDGTMKHEMVILLKILDKLPNEKLDHQLAKTMQILNKRFSK